METIFFDDQPNPGNPALASVIPGDLKTSSGGRNVKWRMRTCKNCQKVVSREFKNRAEAMRDERCPEPCPFCETPFSGVRGLKRGWIYEPMANNISFNPQTAALPDWHKV